MSPRRNPLAEFFTLERSSRAVPAGRRLPFVHDDGGRAAAGFRGTCGDCVTRAIAIATGLPYQQVYDALHAATYAAQHRRGRLGRRARLLVARGRASPRNGIIKEVSRAYLTGLGWQWHACMRIGQGCKVHLRRGELPGGRLIVQCSRHLVAVIDGALHDTGDCSRGGNRCVYGYWTPPA